MFVGGHFNPQTPGSRDDQLPGDWVTTDIQVRILRHEDPGLVNTVGHVRSVSGMMCSIYLPHLDRVINTVAGHLQPILPSRGDQVIT